VKGDGGVGLRRDAGLLMRGDSYGSDSFGGGSVFKERNVGFKAVEDAKSENKFFGIIS